MLPASKSRAWICKWLMENVPNLLSNEGKRKVQWTLMEVHVAGWEWRQLCKIQQEQREDAAPKHDAKDQLMRSEKHLKSEMLYLLTLLDFYQQISN